MITAPVGVHAHECDSRPPPVVCSCATTPHSAHSVTPYAAFSTLQPVDHPAVVDQRRRADRELGVRRVGAPHRLDRRGPQRLPVELVVGRRLGHDFTYGSPSAAGGRTRPTKPATAMMVTR